MTPKDYRGLLKAFVVNFVLIVISSLYPDPTPFSILFVIEIVIAMFIIAGALVDGDYLSGRKDEN